MHAQVISEHLRMKNKKQEHIMLTKRGDIIEGRLIAKDTKTLTFLVKNEFEVIFKRKEVVYVLVKGKDRKDLDKYTGRYNGILNRNESFSPHNIPYLFMTSTAHTLGEGELLYRNLDIFYNTLDYGVSDNIQVGIGVAPLIAYNIFSIDAKYGLQLKEKSRLAIGFKGLTQAQFEFNDWPNVAQNTPYVAYTYGSNRSFVNVKMAYGIKLAESGRNSLYNTVGFSHYWDDKWRVFGELVVGVDEKGFGSRNVSYTTSFVGVGYSKTTTRLDFGMVVFVNSNSFWGVPSIVFSNRLGNY